MKINLNKSVLSLFLLLSYVVVFSQTLPPPPEKELAGDIGANTIPVNMYDVLFFGVAIMMIAFSYRKQLKKLI